MTALVACAATSDGVIVVALCAIVVGLVAGLGLGALLRGPRIEFEQEFQKEHP